MAVVEDKAGKKRMSSSTSIVSSTAPGENYSSKKLKRGKNVEPLQSPIAKAVTILRSQLQGPAASTAANTSTDAIPLELLSYFNILCFEAQW